MEPDQIRTIARFLAERPRQPENIAFVSGADGQFAGNVKYLFLHFARHVPQCTSVFVTTSPDVHRALRGQGLAAACFPSQDALEVLARASVLVADGFQYRERGMAVFAIGAKTVQLWHGVGFKKIGFVEAETSLDLPPERRAYLREMYSGYDAVVSTSPFYTEHLFKTSFGAREIWETGYPRNDALVRPGTKDDLVGCDLEGYARVRALGRRFRLCLYAPTFRDDCGEFFLRGPVCFESLSRFLEREGMVLFLKMHAFTEARLGSEFTNIQVIDHASDVYPLLPHFSCLITDYSSIYMDYLHLDRPVVFFPFDRADYASRMREFQFDYDAMTPGPKCLTQDELERALVRAATDPEADRARRREVRDLAFSHHDGQACRRVAEHILRLAATI